jgi:hypothetical protein
MLKLRKQYQKEKATMNGLLQGYEPDYALSGYMILPMP